MLVLLLMGNTETRRPKLAMQLHNDTSKLKLNGFDGVEQIMGHENVMTSQLRRWMHQKCNILMKEEPLNDKELFDILEKQNLYVSTDSFKQYVPKDETSMQTTLIIRRSEDYNEAIDETFTFGDILHRVINRILKHEHKEELFNILRNHLVNVHGVCIVGKVTGIISVLSGFYDDMQTNFTPNEVHFAAIKLHFENFLTCRDKDEFNYKNTHKIIKSICNNNNLDTESWLKFLEEERDRVALEKVSTMYVNYIYYDYTYNDTYDKIVELEEYFGLNNYYSSCLKYKFLLKFYNTLTLTNIHKAASFITYLNMSIITTVYILNYITEKIKISK